MIFIHDLEGWYDNPKISNIININWGIINKFNEISYDIIGLIIDVKSTWESFSDKRYDRHHSGYYNLILRSLDYHYYYRSDYNIGFYYKEDRLQHCAYSVTRSYLNNIDNQGNIELTSLLQLPHYINESIWNPNINNEIAKSIVNLVDNKINILRNQVDRGLSNVMRY